MKFPGDLDQLFGNKHEKPDVFLSLFLDVDGIVAGAWRVEAGSAPVVMAHATERIDSDNWEDRIEAADRAIASLEEHTQGSILTKVTLGLSSSYLTGEGEIKKEIRGYLKKLTSTLELVAMGFVPVYQAIVYRIKKDEGVPPSVILIGIDSQGITVSVYKVGNLVGFRQLAKAEVIAPGIEDALKGFQDLEVLPSRIRLYGSDQEALEKAKNELLQYPWPIKVNFLHFPKIESLAPEEIIAAISLAGSSELGEIVHEEENIEPAESNVVMVPPEELGFRKDDVLEKPVMDDVSSASSPPENMAQQSDREEKNQETTERNERRTKLNIAVPKFWLPKLRPMSLSGALSIRGRAIAAAIVFILMFITVGGLFYWNVPAATVTINELPQTLSEHADIVIDPTATIVDSEHGIIPGKKQEKTSRGEKTMLVTGKKAVGDPAKGVVTIYNKSLSQLKVGKGTVLKNGTLQFTLDVDVVVASASESLSQGTITYGKANASITAVVIGSEGNLPSGKEFTVKDVSTAVAVARNDQPFSGGTSRDVTVVSRQDMDTLIAVLTKELVVKAKTEQPSGVIGGDDILIEETVKTEITEKEFTEELDQEAKELHGKLSLVISGTSYSTRDANSMFSTLFNKKIPSGYALIGDRTSVTVSGVKVKKDGTVTAKADAIAIATPVIRIADIQKSLAGKKFSQAQDYLRSLPGIGSAEFNFRWTAGNRMPVNPEKISVTVAVHE
ncbi:baseplate J/gp47 family protein [Candidatus Gottesmanbacteria bacterium]|nr:baseplate J/gp47 family protein [Candidatus Gottesmanbacteria bacterium]